MKKYVVLIAIVTAVLVAAFNAFAQDNKATTEKVQKKMTEAQNTRERLQNMSPEEREKFRAQMEQKRKQYQNMSEEERAQLQEQLRERDGSMSGNLGRDAQLKSIKAIEAQVAKLKAAVEAGVPENRSQLRELSQQDRAKLREKIVAAMRDRQTAIRAIEQELAKLRGPSRPPTKSEARLSELRAIHKLAVKENAAQTADRLDKLIMGIQRGSADSEQQAPEGRERMRRERPARPEKTE